MKAMDTAKIRELLKLTKHHDKDERFMATSDLTAELEKVDGQLDSGLQTPIRDAILTQLDDPSNDVQAIACRCLAAVVQKFAGVQVEEIVDKLGQLLLTGRTEIRDIYSIALKTIIGSVPDGFGTQIAKKLAVHLLRGLHVRPAKRFDTREEKQEFERDEQDRRLTCLDILKELLNRFGDVMVTSHKGILGQLFPDMLQAPKVEIRKKTAVTLGALVPYITDDDFKGLVTGVIDSMRKTTDKALLETYIQTIGVFSRQGGTRISSYLVQIVPELLRFCSEADGDTDEARAVTVELRENCLQALEALITRSPEEITPFVDRIMDTVLKLMKWDPNFDYAIVEDDAMDEDEDAGGWDDDDDDGGWGDDEDVNVDDVDDTTWKVRRAAVKVTAAFIRAKNNTMRVWFNQLCTELLGQFKERDVNVKLELFHAFRELLLAAAMTEDGQVVSACMLENAGPRGLPRLSRARSSQASLNETVPKIIDAFVNVFQGKTKDTKSRNGILGVLRELIIVRQGGLAADIPRLIPCVVEAIKDSETTLRTKGLRVLMLLIDYHPAAVLAPHVKDLTPVITEAVKDVYTRVKALSLFIIGKFFEVLRPLGAGSAVYEPSVLPLVNLLYTAALEQLSYKDIEQEVKRAAIGAAAESIAHFGDVLKGNVAKPLALIQQRLGNEVTRLEALKGVATIADSPIKVDLSGCVVPIVQELQTFLKKQQTALKNETLVTLNALVRNSGRFLDGKTYGDLVKNTAEFVSDEDLHLCHLALELQSSIVGINPGSTSHIENYTVPRVTQFVRSPLLQGNALASLKQLLEIYQRTVGNETKYQSLKKQLLGAVGEDISKQSFRAISQCIAALTFQVSDSTQNSTVKDFVSTINSSDNSAAQIALLSIGEIGKIRDLREHHKVEMKIFSAFSRPSEGVKWAASYAFGCVTVGNMKKYLPILLELIAKNPDRQYLLLNSMKEIITTNSETPDTIDNFRPYTGAIVPLLLKSSSSEDEGVRAMLAECLGSIILVDPTKILPQVENLLNDSNPNIRATMVACIKFSLNKKVPFEIPRGSVERFLAIMKDGNLDVKRQAFLTLNAIVHHQTRAVLPYLKMIILPLVFAATPTNDSLIREVDLGPFKHKVDDGLPLRKAAFAALDVIVDNCAHTLNIVSFVDALKHGVTDSCPDIQLQTYHILTRLGTNQGSSIISALDSLPSPLMKGIKAKLQEAKNAKDGERAKDILRASVKALYTLYSIPGVPQEASGFSKFYSRVLKTKLLVQMLEEMQAAGQLDKK